jgi:hypothetical protein
VTKHELDNGWTLDDVLDAHEVLDMHHDLDVLAANERYLEGLARKAGRRG